MPSKNSSDAPPPVETCVICFATPAFLTALAESPPPITVIALDSVDAGVGDTVLIVQEGWGASTSATGKPGAAIDSAIVGVVDYIDLLADEAK